jgi:hypothetical protein
MEPNLLRGVSSACTFVSVLASPAITEAAVIANPTPSAQCAQNTAFFNPTLPSNIVFAEGTFTASVFIAGLNAPTGIAFRGDASNFEVYVLESGHGLPSVCNDQSLWPGGEFALDNPFTPDILVFDKNGRKIRGPLAKPTPSGGGLQPEGPAIDIAFVRGFEGGRLFATDSNQSTHQHNGNNNSSRIVIVNPITGEVTPFITHLPTGDHPTEQLAFKEGWVYWSQGSTTNSGVVGLDNGGGLNQSDIPCQDITLSQNVFISSFGPPQVATSGYSPFGVQQPGATIPAFFNSFTGQVGQGVCDGAILRAPLNNPNNIQAFSWGYRNPYAIRFPPKGHPLDGGILVGMDGADERGNRPSDNAPDELHLGQQNPDGSPDYHGWPDRYGRLQTTQRVYDPIGGPNDDLCPAPFDQATCLANLAKANDIPMQNVLAGPPQPITAPLANEAADSSFTGIDFVPDPFVGGPFQSGAAVYSLEGDFGFSPPNSTVNEVGHEVKLINFIQPPGHPLAVKIQPWAHNTPPFEQAFTQDGVNGFNRPTNVRFGPDGCAYVVDYGAVRDLSDDSHFVGPAANGPLVQIPSTGVVWKICPSG